jgi:hypothetical protein
MIPCLRRCQGFAVPMNRDGFNLDALDLEHPQLTFAQLGYNYDYPLAHSYSHGHPCFVAPVARDSPGCAELCEVRRKKCRHIFYNVISMV